MWYYILEERENKEKESVIDMPGDYCSRIKIEMKGFSETPAMTDKSGNKIFAYGITHIQIDSGAYHVSLDTCTVENEEEK